MVQLFLGLVVLVMVVMGAHWFVTSTPATIMRTAKWAGVALTVGSGAFLLTSGRLDWAFAAVAGLAPWLFRLMVVRNFFRGLRGTFERMSSARARQGGSSRVETRFLRMTLEHDSGVLVGEVMDGPFRGRKLSQLSFDEAMELHRQCAADPQSVQVLEAWLERTWPDWRERPSHQPPPNDPLGGGPMTREEAYAILGLKEEASREEIKAAHRRLMTRMHPDHGGSNFLAVKINQAKDFLLRN
jgi:hypothetical protein